MSLFVPLAMQVCFYAMLGDITTASGERRLGILLPTTLTISLAAPDFFLRNA
jgi:hypothetical protein